MWGVFGCRSPCLLLCPVLKHHLHTSLYFRHYCSSADPPPRSLQVDTSLPPHSLRPGWMLRRRLPGSSLQPPENAPLHMDKKEPGARGHCTGCWKVKEARLSYRFLKLCSFELHRDQPLPLPLGAICHHEVGAVTAEASLASCVPWWRMSHSVTAGEGLVRRAMGVCVCDHSWRKTRQRMNHNGNNGFLGLSLHCLYFSSFKL